jgi:hypothetical protein
MMAPRAVVEAKEKMKGEGLKLPGDWNRANLKNISPATSFAAPHLRQFFSSSIFFADEPRFSPFLSSTPCFHRMTESTVRLERLGIHLDGRE